MQETLLWWWDSVALVDAAVHPWPAASSPKRSAWKTSLWCFRRHVQSKQGPAGALSCTDSPGSCLVREKNTTQSPFSPQGGTWTLLDIHNIFCRLLYDPFFQILPCIYVKGIVSSNTKDITTKVMYPHLNYSIPVSVFQAALQRYEETKDTSVFRVLDMTEERVRRVWRLQVTQSKMWHSQHRITNKRLNGQTTILHIFCFKQNSPIFEWHNVIYLLFSLWQKQTQIWRMRRNEKNDEFLRLRAVQHLNLAGPMSCSKHCEIFTAVMKWAHCIVIE